MEVILLEKVGKLGNLGDKVNVKAGYGRNFLIPLRKAVPATKANLEDFEQRRAELEKAALARRSAAEQRAAALVDLDVTIAAKAGEEGKLYGSIGTREIAEAITKAGTMVQKSEVRLPNGAIRNIGEFEVQIQLATDVMVEVKLGVIEEE